MNIKKLFAVMTFVSSIGIIYCQEDKKTMPLPSLAVGIGVLSFNGDVGSGLGISSFGKFKVGYNLTVEERIGKYFGVSINGLYGKLADEENSSSRNLNFQSTIYQGDVNALIHFNNNLFFEKNSSIVPYLSAGIGFLKFDPYGDLKDKNGTPYHYWSDGSIHNLAQNDLNASHSVIIQRDYTYETQLKDSITNYKRNTLSFPIGIGFKLNIVYNLDINLSATYYFTQSDWIDNFKSGKNDKYLYTNFSIQYNFGKSNENSKSNSTSVDFSALDKLDTDEDGVKDNFDQCPGTPKGVKVNSRGCPIDTDEDGVPDYLDKEPNTKKGAVVDENGVTLTESQIAKKLAMDSIATERINLLHDNPSLDYLKRLEAKAKEAHKNDIDRMSKIPYSLRSIDKNQDGFINTDEIMEALDDFFAGDASITMEKLNTLIDFFFDQ